MTELPKAYIPKDSEREIYERWRSSGYFNPDQLPGKRQDSYCISMPPANATGVLHVGHAVMLALQDILIRFERMRGKKTLWLPGTDHAAIATQNVVEKELKKKGKSRHDLGREKFLEYVDEFVKTSQATIRKQIESMGASCDWSRERFTLDEGLSEAVREAFVELYKDGLIYRGTRVVNWCPKDQSTLADDEIEYKKEVTELYSFKYDKKFPIPISTTRPETKFGDTAVAVHPDDEKYKNYIGKEYEINFFGAKRKIRIVADKAVDPSFGTGALGVTPAHSSIDEAIARREKLASIKVIDEDGKMTKEVPPQFQGLTAKQARARLVEMLKDPEQSGGQLLWDGPTERIVHNLSVCYRCGSAIEPLPSLQWFIAVDKPTKRLKGKSLKQRALAVVEKNEISFIPSRFTNVYKQWMENLHDWCISRQIWYGHRIPVWYQDDKIHVGTQPKGQDWKRDEDTLDTWFSSALWTFSTLGWPKKTRDLKTFHPTTVMETGYDIIFFWVARMVLVSTYLLDQMPFKTVYLHGLVRDRRGRKMSKSLGNGIDPLTMAEKYGADAVRLSLTIGTTPGNDQRLYEEKIASFRNYANKIWNIARFLAMQDPPVPSLLKKGGRGGSLADRWILSCSRRLVDEVTSDLENFRFSQAAERIYDFVWHKLADWYLEIAKLQGLATVGPEVFRVALTLLHPFMPFVTERLWQNLGLGKELLMVEPWPTEAGLRKVNPFWTVDLDGEKEFAELQERINTLRKQRVESRATPGEPWPVKAKKTDLVWRHQEIVERLARIRLDAA